MIQLKLGFYFSENFRNVLTQQVKMIPTKLSKSRNQVVHEQMPFNENKRKSVVKCYLQRGLNLGSLSFRSDALISELTRHLLVSLRHKALYIIMLC